MIIMIILLILSAGLVIGTALFYITPPFIEMIATLTSVR